jgi:predicted nucleotide-binding protein (sugar kinase/HSP70/actin superfamily)
MMDIAEFNQLKANVDKLTRERDKAQGAFEQSLVELEKEFGCKTIKEAVALQEKLAQQASKAERDYEKALSAFKTKWNDVLSRKD